MRKIVLTFGLISGAISSLMMIALVTFGDRIGFDRGANIGNTSIVLSFLMVFFGIRTYRDNIGNGQITFLKAFAVGLSRLGREPCGHPGKTSAGEKIQRAVQESILQRSAHVHSSLPDWARHYADFRVDSEAKASIAIGTVTFAGMLKPFRPFALSGAFS